jgi:NHLM bacteriocin system ABC transporter ATP-binding protein
LKKQGVHKTEIQRKVKRDQDYKAVSELMLAEIVNTKSNKKKFRSEIKAANSTNDLCVLVAKSGDVALNYEIKKLKSDSSSQKVIEFATYQKIRYRRILLEGEWWKHNNGPFIGFDKQSGKCVAILNISGKNFLVATSSQKEVRVTKSIAKSISNYGFTFFRPFPKNKLELKPLLKFAFKPIKSELYRLLLLGVTYGLFSAFIPIATGIVYNNAIPSANTQMLYELALGLFMAGVGMAAFHLTRSYTVLRIEGKIALDLQAALWDKLLNLPVSFFKKYSAGDLANRAMGINTMRHILSDAVIGGILGAIFSVFNFALLFYYSPKLGLVATVITILFIALSTFLHIQELKVRRELTDQSGRLSGKILQFMMGVSKIRVEGAEYTITRQWSFLFKREMQLESAVIMYSNIIRNINNSVPLLFVIIIFWFMGSSDEAISTGDFIAFSAAFGTFLSAIISLNSSFISVFKVLPIYERFKPILNENEESAAGMTDPGPLSGYIELNSINFKYQGTDSYLIDQLSIKIKPGEYVALIGPSGAGKSTLFRLLLGFEVPDSGSIYYDNQDLATLDIKAVRRQFGVVLQNGQLEPETILKNIVGSSNLGIDDAWEAAKKAGIEKEIRKLPMGMHTVIPEGGGSFSGGQQQRLIIARALARNPKILLFDEATSALDNQSQQIITDTLDGLDVTRIVIAHRMSTIKHVDRVFVIDKGKIVQEGSIDELASTEGLFKELASRQKI